jgi:peptidoglycan L-alanyl-D-glutamate endopeptidase CwlK
MPIYGANSLKNLSRVHPDLVKVFTHVVKRYDNAIICGWRSHKDQQKAFDTGVSTLRPGLSMHNGWRQEQSGAWVPDVNGLSLAVDAAPYPIDWEDIPRFNHFGHYVLGVADGLGIALRWGGDWNRNWDLKDQRLHDRPHFELANIIKGVG